MSFNCLKGKTALFLTHSMDPIQLSSKRMIELLLWLIYHRKIIGSQYEFLMKKPKWICYRKTFEVKSVKYINVTVSVILKIGEYIYTKIAMSKLPGYPWNLNLIKMWKITQFFLTQKVIIVSCKQEMRKSLCRESTNENKHNLKLQSL